MPLIHSAVQPTALTLVMLLVVRLRLMWLVGQGAVGVGAADGTSQLPTLS